jgi:hypothetical protein
MKIFPGGEIKCMKKIIYFSLVIGIFFSFLHASVNGQTPAPTPTPTPKTVKTEPSVTDYSLVIENEEGKQTKLTLADLGKLKRQTVKVSNNGKENSFEGFALVDVLKLTGIAFGETLRGKRLATFLLVEAADNYQVVFALPELDAAFNDKVVLLVDKRDGEALSKTEGPLRLVIPDEKKAGRWVRQVTSIKILRAGTPSNK